MFISLGDTKLYNMSTYMKGSDKTWETAAIQARKVEEEDAARKSRTYIEIYAAKIGVVECKEGLLLEKDTLDTLL